MKINWVEIDPTCSYKPRGEEPAHPLRKAPPLSDALMDFPDSCSADTVGREDFEKTDSLQKNRFPDNAVLPYFAPAPLYSYRP